MRVMIVSWEYPPLVIGGLGRHVHALAVAQAAAGHEVTVVTRHTDGAAYDERVEGVRVVRVPADPPLLSFETDLLAWTMALNHALARGALGVVGEARPEVVHAHDWLVAHAAITLKHHLGVPLVATVHATEAGRHQGWLPAPMNAAIHSVEWWLTYEARRVIACSEHMRREVTALFELPGDKVDMLPNGVDPADWTAPRSAVDDARRRHADAGPLVVFVGRLEWEKGVQDLLAATPRLRRRHPGLRVVVAGTGTHEAELRAHARRSRLGRAVRFTGRLDGGELVALLGAADAAVVPSRYEPFGLVALEAAAAGVPLAVADTGGLAEIVDSGRTGLSFPPGDPAALADAVDRLLADEVSSRRMVHAARAALDLRHRWPDIAESTVDVYRRAELEERRLRVSSRPSSPPLRLAVPSGNLFSQRLGATLAPS